MKFLLVSAALAILLLPSAAGAALSDNLFNANFETTSNLKNVATYDSNNLAIGPHRFNSAAATGDWNMWLGRWGPPRYGGLGGFSAINNPRQLGATMAGTADPNDDLGNNNVSIDPYNPASGNHIMETIAFYPTMIQWAKAPANQTTGPMQLSFDFFLNHFDADYGDWNTLFNIEVYGSNFAPEHNIGLDYSPYDNGYTIGIGSAFSPTGGAPSVNVTDPDTQIQYRSQMLARFGWGQDWTNWDANRPQAYPETNGWVNMDSGVSAPWYEVDQDDWGNLIIPVNLTETFQYYSVTISTAVYHEDHDYFWLVSGYGVNGYSATDQGPAVGFDNIDFRISVANAVVLADVNLDGNVNALDISGFINRLTTGAYQAEADINEDSAVNALDISGFVSCLTGGACGAGSAGGVVPEPASLALLSLSAFALMRRR